MIVWSKTRPVFDRFKDCYKDWSRNPIIVLWLQRKDAMVIKPFVAQTKIKLKPMEENDQKHLKIRTFVRNWIIKLIEKVEIKKLS